MTRYRCEVCGHQIGVGMPGENFRAMVEATEGMPAHEDISEEVEEFRRKEGYPRKPAPGEAPYFERVRALPKRQLRERMEKEIEEEYHRARPGVSFAEMPEACPKCGAAKERPGRKTRPY